MMANRKLLHLKCELFFVHLYTIDDGHCKFFPLRYCTKTLLCDFRAFRHDVQYNGKKKYHSTKYFRRYDTNALKKV